MNHSRKQLLSKLQESTNNYDQFSRKNGGLNLPHTALVRRVTTKHQAKRQPDFELPQFVRTAQKDSPMVENINF